MKGLSKNWNTILIIVLCWTLFVSFAFVVEYFFLVDLINLNKLSGYYSFWPDFLATILLSIFAGLVFGYLLVNKMSSKFIGKTFAFGIVNAGLFFIVIYLMLAVVGIFTLGFVYFSFTSGITRALKEASNNVIVNISTPSFFVNMIAWAILVSATQFMLQVRNKFGPGILWKFITGKYYHPRQEERIFMFLDLRSATTIAEKIGSNKFFYLLKETYRDITEPIISCAGEIYQYVGDEVVITWTIKNGLKDNNCLECFFLVSKTLKNKKLYYTEKYGHCPEFKAGLHIGESTVGEIGVIKKDIVFSGDVLNTTSRIQGECNNYNVSLLVSSELLKRLALNGKYDTQPLGAIPLKGKAEKLELYSITLDSC